VLETFLNNKPLFYDEIDYTRMPRVYEKVKDRLKIPKIIHLIGTNGKGTTGRFLATALHNLSFNVGHYTSPHILEFNERIWLNGSCVSNNILNSTHAKLLKLLSKEDADSLSYFEYTTFLAMLIYKDTDYIVLEAGLGGEHDATAVFPKVLTLITPIDIDHEAFLGSTIKAIATTKLKAVQKHAIIAKQKHKEVYDVALNLEDEYGVSIEGIDAYIKEKDKEKIFLITQNNKLVPYLVQNLSLAVCALKFLNIEYKVDEGGGAFYGPKIDIKITDALKRKWQCGTIQVDFNLPERFNLSFTNKDDERETPVMIHRAILGSFERFIAILIEHFAGEFPFPIAPNQVIFIPIRAEHQDYAFELNNKLSCIDIDSEVYDQNESLNKRIRIAEKSKVPMVVIIGDKEVADKSVAIRDRREKSQYEMSEDEFMKALSLKITQGAFA